MQRSWGLVRNLLGLCFLQQLGALRYLYYLRGRLQSTEAVRLKLAFMLLIQRVAPALERKLHHSLKSSADPALLPFYGFPVHLP